MSDFIVGKEILPNVYIKRVSVYDGKLGHTEAIRVSLCLVDRVSDLDPSWSDNHSVLKLMKLVFVGTGDSELIRRINEGSIKISQEELNSYLAISREPVTGVSQPYVSVVSLAKLPEPTTEGNYNYYNFSFDLTRSLADSNFSIFSAIILDDAELGNLGINTFSPTGDLVGPISSEDIFVSNRLQDTTKVLLNPNGTQYNGPVHLHEGGYMEGSYHKSTPHAVITINQVANFKIKDMRQIVPPLVTPMLSTKNSNYFTDLYDSINQNGNVLGVFGVNVKKILVERTKFGSKLLNLNPRVLEDLQSSFKISRFAVIRNKVKVAYSSTQIGGLKLNYSDFIDSEEIGSSYDVNGSITPFSRILDNKEMAHDVLVSDLPTLDNESSRKDTQIYTNDLSKYKQLSNIKEVFLDLDQGSRFFEFNDFGINDNRAGYFVYKLDLTFKDPTIGFITNLYRSIFSTLKMLKDYLSLFSSRKNYNTSLEKARKRFYDSQDALYSEDYNKAPWIKASDVLSKMFSYLYDYSEEEIKNLSLRFLSLLEPKTATLESINYFIDLYDKTTKKMINFFEINPNTIKENQNSVYPKNTPRSTNVMIENVFNKIITPVENKKRYTFLTNNSTQGNLTLNYGAIAERISLEKNKLFNRSPSGYSDKDIEKEGLQSLTQIEGKSSFYFGPLSVRDTTNLQETIELNLTEPNLFKDKSYGLQLDKVFNNLEYKSNDKISTTKKSFQFNTKFSQSPRQRFTFFKTSAVESLTDEEDKESESERLITAEEYLGTNSSFSIYEKELREKLQTLGINNTAFSISLANSISNQKTVQPLSSKTFSLKSDNSVVQNLKKVMTPEVLGNVMATVPNHIKAMMLSNTPRSNFEPDKIFSKDRNLYTKVANLNLMKLQSLSGFGFDTNTDSSLLNKPAWAEIDLENPDIEQGAMLCRLEEHIDPRFGIGTDQNIKLPVVNKYFFISNRDVYEKINFIQQEGISNIETLKTSYFENFNYNMDFCTNNIVKQPSNMFSENVIEEAQETQTDVEVPVINVPPTALPTGPAGREPSGGTSSGGTSSGGGGY